MPSPSMDFAARLALLYAAIFGTIGVQMPFLPLWLTAKGLDAPAIGAVLAVGTATRMIAVPLGTRAADRLGSARTGIVLAAVATAVAMTLLGLSGTVATIFVAYALATAGFAVVMPLTESHALQGLAARGRAYGPVRLWGSVAFIAANLGAGWLTGLIARENVIWIIVAGYWLLLGAAILVPPATAEPQRARPAGANRSMLADPRLLLVLGASGLIQASHSFVYGFSTLQWTHAGLDGLAIGALWAVGVAAEIVLFALQARLPAALAGPFALLIVGAAGGVLRWGGMAFDPATGWLPLLQALHGLSFGAAHLGAVQFVARAAVPGRAATTQGLLAWTNGLAMAGAMAASGLLYSAFGPAGYAAMAAMAGIGGILALWAGRIEPRPAAA